MSQPDSFNKTQLIVDLTRDEGKRRLVYDDATGLGIRPGVLVRGHATVGIGRALDVNGISDVEAEMLCGNDIDMQAAALFAALNWLAGLDPARQRALINMAFNMGTKGVLGFTNTLELAKDGRYADAATAMLASKWASQVGARAQRLAAMMRDGGE